MNGHELAERLIPQRPEMKVLFMSGYTDGAVATHGVLKPGIRILRKPFSLDTLAKNVAEALAEKRGQGTSDARAEYEEVHEYSS